jgi:HEAT repeat protein
MNRDATGEQRSGTNRTTADVCATLVELSRTLKGWSFYASGHGARRELLDRSWRALQGELRRNGPLALEVRRGALWLMDSDVAIGAGRVDDLARQLEERAVRRLVFEADLDADTLSAFLDTLVATPEALAAEGGFEASFYDGSCRGVQVNEADWRNLLARAQFAASTPAPADAPIATAATVEPVAEEVAVIEEVAAPETLPILDEEPVVEMGGDELDFEDLPVARGDITAPIELLEDLGPVGIDESPLDADPKVASALELVERLRELTECDDDHRYRDLVHQTVYAAQELVGQGVADEGYRTLLVLATHAGDDAKRSFAQRESASEGLAQLAHGAALDDLMKRACDPSADTSLHATGILRELGARCAPRVLDRLEVEMDSERRERLTGVMLAMGEDVAPALAEAIASGSKRRQRLALRLAGETQNPRLVASLREAMLDGHDEVAREAAHALLRIGDVSSLDALAEGLASPRASVASFAAYSLGASGRVLAVAPLAEALGRTLAAHDLALAREFVRALGRLGRAEAARPIAAILAHGGFFQRRKLRDLKLAAITALSGLPGRDAADALARAARSSDAQLRQPAALAQKRRAQSAKPA